ncbi:hypothetical protein GOP47_0005236 [Adiantum capillus-veneris]|uniref:Pentatricopeptide repeat-containing protein n=1 Tax=Adiantum capillus-veneris TaxID=13818 RepID=A0A9D4V5G6_ADICA|nr:hypothetical protein GOP47_0005236 [Adiantum capillus-veneris]
MHIEFGDLETAQRVFDELPKANEVSWGKLIKGYAQKGYAFPALQLFEKTQREGVQPSKTIYMYVLKACMSARLSKQGKLIHDQIVRYEFEKDAFIETSIIEFYVQSGQFVEALLMFHKSQNHDIMTWGVLLDGYLQHDLMDSVLQLFLYMQTEEVKLDAFTYSCALKACTSPHDLKLVHDHIIKQTFEENVSVCNVLIGIYSSHGNIDEACWVFQRLQTKDVASWTVLIQGLVDCGRCLSALCVYEEMQDSGVQPSEVTYMCLIKACIMTKDVYKGRLAHDEMMRSGLACSSRIGNALIDMYGSCGYVYEARNVFDGLDSQDEVSWGTMMVVYSQHGHDILALELFEKMQQKKGKQTASILLCILRACGKVGAIVWGKLIHYLLMINGFESDWAVISTLIYMYAECGYMIEVHKVFHSLPSPDLATWSILIAHCGNMDLARQLLTDMKRQSVNPNAQLYTNILTTCACEGLLEEGEGYFEIMRKGHGIGSNLWHCTSMANLLGRTGHTKEAYDLLQALPMPPDEAIWRALLSGCKLHEDVGLGEHSFDQAINRIDGGVLLQDWQCKEVALSGKFETPRGIVKDQDYWKIGHREKLEEQHLSTQQQFDSKYTDKNDFLIETLHQISTYHS